MGGVGDMKLTARCGSTRSPELLTCAPLSAGIRPPVGLRDLDRRLLLCNASMLLVLPLVRAGHCPGEGVTLSQYA